MAVRLGMRIADRLRQQDSLTVLQGNGFCQGRAIQKPANNGRQSFRCATEIHVFGDRTGVSRRIESCFRAILPGHARKIGDIDEFSRRNRDEVLLPGEGTQILRAQLQQRMGQGIIKEVPLREEKIDVDFTRVARRWRRTRTVWPIDAEGTPQQRRENLKLKWTSIRFPNAAPR